jgi:hypothetical protein
VGVSQLLEPLKALLLQIVFRDECHGVRLKNLPMAATGRTLALQGGEMFFHSPLAQPEALGQLAS